MASNEGFLTEEQREVLKIASQNMDVLSSSPKSPKGSLLDHIKAPAGGKAPAPGINVRHVRRTHSGKHIRVKKGEFICHYCCLGLLRAASLMRLQMLLLTDVIRFKSILKFKLFVMFECFINSMHRTQNIYGLFDLMLDAIVHLSVNVL